MADNKKTVEATVEDKLRALYALQTIDSKTDEIHRQCGELPLEVQDKEDELVGRETRITKYKNEIVACEKEIAQYKNDIEVAKDNIKKYEQQFGTIEEPRAAMGDTVPYDILGKA